jgi:tetratricopeptide (TPR) repeat protein
MGLRLRKHLLSGSSIVMVWMCPLFAAELPPQAQQRPVQQQTGVSGMGWPEYKPWSNPLNTAAGMDALIEHGFKLGVEHKQENDKLVQTGQISALDLSASAQAVRDFNAALKLFQQESSRAAIVRLQKAIQEYPSFVSAHILLGLAYEDLNKVAEARAEYELAAKLDPEFPGPLVALGHLEVGTEDLEPAKVNLEKAITLLPPNASLLAMLCYAQHGTGDYRHAIETAARVHSLSHPGLATVHYLAAASASKLDDPGLIKRELEMFVQEDPNSLWAPLARLKLEELSGQVGPQSAKPSDTKQGAKPTPPQ